MGRKLIDLTNQKFGLLTVIERDLTVPDKKHSYWKCKCDCGNPQILTFSGDNLRGGRVNSCGCLRHQSSPIFIEEIGKKHGKLTVKERVTPLGQMPIKYLCECECGNTCVVAGNDLRSGHTTSCGCVKSKGEHKISQILKENHIPFKTQYSFSDLYYSNKNILLKFDFAIFEGDTLKYLIEYQGEQHYKPMRYTNDEQRFEQRRIRDKLKIEYCQNHNIPLIIVPYTQYNDLTLTDLILKEK